MVVEDNHNSWVRMLDANGFLRGDEPSCFVRSVRSFSCISCISPLPLGHPSFSINLIEPERERDGRSSRVLATDRSPRSLKAQPRGALKRSIDRTRTTCARVARGPQEVAARSTSRIHVRPFCCPPRRPGLAQLISLRAPVAERPCGDMDAGWPVTRRLRIGSRASH